MVAARELIEVVCELWPFSFPLRVFLQALGRMRALGRKPGQFSACDDATSESHTVFSRRSCLSIRVGTYAPRMG